MKKSILIISILLLSLTQIQAQFCECGDNALYNQKLNKCVELPPPLSQQIEGCQDYIYNSNFSGFYCEKCQPSYILQYGECIKTDKEHCIYFLNQMQQAEEQEKTFLQEQKYHCIACQQGFYYNYDGNCAKNPVAGQQNHIDNCFKYYYNTYVMEMQCGMCNSYYYLKNDNQCLPYPKNVENCSNYSYDKSQNTSICTNCDSNYNLIDGQCIVKPPIQQGCIQQIYNQKSRQVECTACDGEEGYAQDDQDYQKCVKIQKIIPLCKYGTYFRKERQYVCQQCVEGYYVQNNHCKQNPTKKDQFYLKNCLVYRNQQNRYLKCSKCSHPYAPNSLGQCVKGEEVANCSTYQYSYSKQERKFFTQCLYCEKGYGSGFNNDNSCQKCPSLQSQDRLQASQIPTDLQEGILGFINELVNKLSF